MYTKNYLKFLLPILLIALTGLSFIACSDRGDDPNPDQVFGFLKDFSECGGFSQEAYGKSAVSYDDTLSCIDYTYSDNTLTINHFNTAFNCCPVITGTVGFRGDTIVLNEIESFDQGGACHCLCLFDLTFEVGNLPANEYVVAVRENYLDESEAAMVFHIDLTNDSSGHFCVKRDYYPWGLYAEPE